MFHCIPLSDRHHTALLTRPLLLRMLRWTRSLVMLRFHSACLNDLQGWEVPPF
jgi:hypothetical protein